MLRFAIIGTSRIAEQFAAAVAECNCAEATAVYSRTIENAQRFADVYGIPGRITSLEELASSQDFDAVYVASPNSCHFEHSVMMLRGKKHVLCEKPIATCAEELHQMLRVAEENGVVLLEASMHMFSPGLEQLRSLLPEVGTIRRASFVMNQYSSRYDSFKQGETHNIFSKEHAGGALNDLGIYCVEIMTALFGEPESLVASMIYLRTGVDGQGAIIAKYDGFLVELSYSKISQSVTPCAVQGEEGSLVFSWPSIIDKIDVVKRNGEKRQVICMGSENQMVYEIQAFSDIVNEPKKAEPYNRCSLMAQSVMDQAKAFDPPG